VRGEAGVGEGGGCGFPLFPKDQQQKGLETVLRGCSSQAPRIPSVDELLLYYYFLPRGGGVVVTPLLWEEEEKPKEEEEDRVRTTLQKSL
jgi:hypothetical protein